MYNKSMKQDNGQFRLAVATMIGMVIGVGFFGVPYAVSQVGLVVGIGYILILGLVMLLVHLLYGEVVLRTKKKHRFIGYVEKYLGLRYRRIAMVTSTLGFYSALIAYIIIGGKFLFFIFSPFVGGSELVFQVLFFVLLSITIYYGIRVVSNVTAILTWLMIGLIAVLIAIALPRADFTGLSLPNWSNIFLPYGVILFALSGAPAVPEICDILKGKAKKLAQAICISMGVAVVLTALFAFAIVGIGRGDVSKDAISTLAEHLGSWALIAGSIMGFLAVATSFLVLGLNLKEQFFYDLHEGKALSFFLALGVPFIAFLFLTRDFITIIGFAGAVFTAIDSALLVRIWQKSRVRGERMPEYRLNIGNWIGWVLIGVFVLGAAYEVIVRGT